jgi:hypothetical protein
MNKILISAALLLVQSCVPAYGQRIEEIDSLPKQKVETNYVINPSCAKNGVTGITGSTTVSKSATVLDDTGTSCSFDATANGNTYTWATRTFKGIKGQSCSAEFVYTGDMSLYKAQVKQNSVVVNDGGAVQLLNAGTNNQPVILSFPCGDNTYATTFQIEATDNAAAAAKVGKVWIGKNRNIGNVSQAILLGGMTQDGATSCNHLENTSTGLTDYDQITGASGCNAWTTTGSIVPTGTNQIGFSFPNMPPGEYLFELSGYVETNTANQTCLFRLNDGTTQSTRATLYNSAGAQATAPMSFWMSYSNAASRTFTLEAADDGAGRCGVNNAAAAYQVSWRVYRFPSQSETVVRSDQLPGYYDGIIGTSSVILSTGSVGSFTELTNGTMTLTPSSMSEPMGIVCSGTNAATSPSKSATTCAAGNEGVGVNFNLKKTGAVNICVQHFWQATTAASPGSYVQPYFDIVETSSNSQTIIQQTGTNSQGYISTTSSSASASGFPISVCGVLYFSNSGNKTIRLMYKQNVGNAPSVNQIDPPFRITIKPLSEDFSLPFIPGNVTSNSSGSERIERARVTNSGTPSVANQSGSWITSITDNGTGDSTINISSGIFSAMPTCTCTAKNGFNRICGIETTGSATSVQVYTSLGGVAAGVDYNFDIICMGPR